ncbi:MAG: hypothetical protein CFE24_02975 [Flavobacterium sp. BFFFF2]|nr:MAG: hypothetical protein CFE24_02975 [Flavobacterium sp. BFFFF2]
MHMTKSYILIVEDELLIALDMQEILELEGYKVVLVSSIEEAIGIIDTITIDLVLIDIHLNKDKNGLDLGRLLLHRDNIPYAYVTSYSDKTTLEKVQSTRPHGYIVKPFKPSDLIANVYLMIRNYKYHQIDVFRKDHEIDDENPFILKEVITYIDNNLHEKIELKDLLNISKWKSKHIVRMFIKYMKMSPTQYIIDKRLEKAKALLEETDIPNRQISYEIGFRSYTSFLKYFKKNTQMTPEEYRNKVKLKNLISSRKSSQNNSTEN